jgi:hypothetical protein
MPPILKQIGMAAVVGGVVFLIAIGVGMVLGMIPPAVAIGAFLTQWAVVIGLLAGLWYFFTHGPA